MAEIKIAGALADYLADAAEHLAKLENEVRDLRWRICYHPDYGPDPRDAKKQCRELMSALKMIEYYLFEASDKPLENVVEIRERKVP